jgi:DNA-binding CsgD family transcriptional regulator
MPATLHIASKLERQSGRGMAEDAASMLEVLALLKEGALEQAVERVNDLSGSANLLKLTGLLCSDPLTRSDLALRRTRRRLLGVLGFRGLTNRGESFARSSNCQAGVPEGNADAVPLSPRQTAVLLCVREGMTNTEAAAVLQISLNTVKWHLKELSRVLGARNRCALVHRAQQRGLI